MKPVVELGCGRSPDPRATVRTDIRETSATECLVSGTDLPFTDASVRGLIAWHVLEHLDDPAEFFVEAVRVLEPGGWIEFAVPLGGLAKIDPTHRTEWTFETPEYFVDGGKWDYYFDLQLELVDRDVRVWFDAPAVHYFSPLLRLAADRWSGSWLSTTPWLSGVMTVRMRKCDPTEKTSILDDDC